MCYWYFSFVVSRDLILFLSFSVDERLGVLWKGSNIICNE